MAVKQVYLNDIKQMLEDGANGDMAKLNEAEHTLHQLLARDPDNWILLFFMAGLRLTQGFNGEAIGLLNRAHELNPKSSEVLNNIGTCYRRENHREQAEQALLKALELTDSDADVYNNLGTLHINEGTPAQGEEYLRKAVELKPEHAHSHWNLGLCLLEQEKWEEGFKEYAWGLTTRDRMVKDYGNAVWWDGKDKPGKTLVVYGEQGIGDEIMFASCLADLIKTTSFEKIIFDCHPRLIGMFKRAFPELTHHPTRKIFMEKMDWVDDERPDYKVAIGTLPRFYRKTNADFPKQPYLKADPERVEEIGAWLDQIGGPIIGLSWVGGHKKTRKDLRAVMLEHWLPLFEAFPDATFVSLQYSEHGQEGVEWAKEQGIELHHFPEIVESKRWESWDIVKDGEVLDTVWQEKEDAKRRARELGGELIHKPGPGYDYDDTMALVQAIAERGTIVSVNTSLVHLCGAMGVKAFILTPNKPAWRYGLTRADMVWYPKNSIRQYRQRANGDWKGPLIELVNDVKAYLGRPALQAVAN